MLRARPSVNNAGGSGWSTIENTWIYVNRIAGDHRGDRGYRRIAVPSLGPVEGNRAACGLREQPAADSIGPASLRERSQRGNARAHGGGNGVAGGDAGLFGRRGRFALPLRSNDRWRECANQRRVWISILHPEWL